MAHAMTNVLAGKANHRLAINSASTSMLISLKIANRMDAC
jgi:hypothetical protein